MKLTFNSLNRPSIHLQKTSKIFIQLNKQIWKLPASNNSHLNSSKTTQFSLWVNTFTCVDFHGNCQMGNPRSNHKWNCGILLEISAVKSCLKREFSPKYQILGYQSCYLSIFMLVASWYRIFKIYYEIFFCSFIDTYQKYYIEQNLWNCLVLKLSWEAYCIRRLNITYGGDL